MTTTAVVAWTIVESGDLTMSSDGTPVLTQSDRTRIGPALARAFDDLATDSTACAACEALVGYVIETEPDDDGRDVGRFRTVALLCDVSNGRAWALCEDCSAVLDPISGRMLGGAS